MLAANLLLFDLGGVLTASSAFENLKRLLPDACDESLIRERWLASPAVRAFECGAISADAFAEAFVTEWGLNLAPQDFLAEFAVWPGDFFPGVRDMLRQLRKTHRIACLSNSNALHCQRFNVLEDDFDLTFFSHRLGVVKPDREAFVLALGESGSRASEVYFFDDCLANVRSAQSLGITAFQVDGFESLRRLLLDQGLLST